MTNKNSGDLRNCLEQSRVEKLKVERANSRVASRPQSKLKNEFKWQKANGSWSWESQILARLDFAIRNSNSHFVTRVLCRNCQLPTANCQLPTANCPLPTAHCPLPTAHCPLPTAHCLLPTAYCLLPIAFSPSLHNVAHFLDSRCIFKAGHVTLNGTRRRKFHQKAAHDFAAWCLGEGLSKEYGPGRGDLGNA